MMPRLSSLYLPREVSTGKIQNMAHFGRMEWVKKHPRLGLPLAEFIGRNRFLVLGRDSLTATPPRKEFEELFGPVSRKQVRAMRADFAGKCERRFVMERILQDGDYILLEPLVRWEHPERILGPLEAGRPVIAVTFHVGPFAALGVGLTALRKPLTLLLSELFILSSTDMWEALAVPDSAQGARAFLRCSARLKEGGIVALAGDRFTFGEDGEPITILDTRVRILRGFASMARLTKALVIPVAVKWGKHGALVFEAQPPLPSTERSDFTRGTYETAVLREFVDRADRLMRERPSEIDAAIFTLLIEARRYREGKRRKWKNKGATKNRPASSEGGPPAPESLIPDPMVVPAGPEP